MICSKYKELSIYFNHKYITVTDPCYDDDVWCRHSLRILPGRYNFIAYIDPKTNRIVRVSIAHSDFAKLSAGPSRHVCLVGVDSGTVGFFVNKPNYNDSEWEAICSKCSSVTNKWTKPLIRTCNSKSPEKCIGAYVSSGSGDGFYPVYARKLSSGEAVYIQIDF